MVSADVYSEYNIQKTEEHKDWNKYNAPKNSVQFLPLFKIPPGHKLFQTYIPSY